MRFGTPGATGFGGGMGGFSVTPWVKALLIANAAVFLVSVAFGFEAIADLFAFSPGRLLSRPWGMLTYMFVHQGLWHLLLNLLVVFFFGPPLESRWGSDLFIKFYLICGLGGVLLSFAFSDASIVGASAACYGIMLGFAMIWPNAPVHVWGVVPVKVKWVVVFLVSLSFASALGPGRDGVAHLAHLGGAAAAFLLARIGWLSGTGPGPSVRTRRPRRRRGGLDLTGRIRRAGGRGRSRPRGTGPSRAPGGAAPRSGADPNAATLAGRPRVIDLVERDRAAKRVIKEHIELNKVDEVLDKISAEGIASLTAEERELLDRVSKRTRAN